MSVRASRRLGRNMTPSWKGRGGAAREWVAGWALHLAEVALTVFARGRSAILVLPDYRDLDQVRDALEAATGRREVEAVIECAGAEESLRLALIAALQYLPPKQRAVFLTKSATTTSEAPYVPLHEDAFHAIADRYSAVRDEHV